MVLWSLTGPSRNNTKKICPLRKAKGKGEKKSYTHLNTDFQRIARRDDKAFLSDQCKEIEGKIEWEEIEISSRKLELPKEYFMQR